MTIDFKGFYRNKNHRQRKINGLGRLESRRWVMEATWLVDFYGPTVVIGHSHQLGFQAQTIRHQNKHFACPSSQALAGTDPNQAGTAAVRAAYDGASLSGLAPHHGQHLPPDAGHPAIVPRPYVAKQVANSRR
jgi:hypothetical protein